MYATKFNARAAGQELQYTAIAYTVGAVDSGMVYLQEIPLGASVVITNEAGTVTFTEVTDPAAVLSATQYRVAYEGDLGAGRIQFGAANATVVKITSKGTGAGLYAHELNWLRDEKVSRDGSIPFTGPVKFVSQYPINIYVAGADNYSTFTVVNSGQLEWGAGGVTARDTYLHRLAANRLKTGGGLAVLGAVQIGGDVDEGYRLDVQGSFRATGVVGLGGAPSTSVGLHLQHAALTGSTTLHGILSAPIGTTGGTARIVGVTGQPATVAATFTVADAIALWAAGVTKGAGSTISNAYGLKIEDITTGGTNYSIYTGSAPSHFGGTVTTTGQVDAGTYVSVSGLASATATTTSWGVDALHFSNPGYNHVISSANGMGFYIDSNNDSTTGYFVWGRDTKTFGGVASMMYLHESGNLNINLGATDTGYRLDVGGTVRLLGNEGLRIDTFGRIGVNTAPTTARIHIDYPLGTDIGIILNTTTSGTGSAMIFRNAGIQVGSIVTSAAGTTYNASSDRRLKRGIRDTADGLAALRKIRVRDFEFNAAPGFRTQGFIAQELYEVYPHAVSRPTDPQGFWQVDYGRLTPLIVSGLQDLDIDVIALQARGKSLERDVIVLQARVKSLEKEVRLLRAA